jgi:glycosyltransferase involved in cell wall biosynthesis
MAALFLLNSLQVGGSEAKTVRLVNALSDKKHPVYLGCLNFSDPLRSSISESVPVLDFRRKGKLDLQAVDRIVECIRRLEIRNLFCINLYPSLYGILARARSSRLDFNCISCINITDFASVGEALKMIVYRPVLRRATKIVFGCRNQQDQWISRYGLKKSRCLHIYNGVDLHRFSPIAAASEQTELRSHFGFSPREIIVVSVAQFRQEKKQEDLIEACSLLVQRGYPIQLVLVGDGPERSQLQESVRKTGRSDRIHFLGQLSDVRPVLGAADVFALSSVAVETFSNAALEAMAMGLPVVLSNIGGAAEMVEDGVNGFLFPPGDVAALAKKLALLADDSETRKRMSIQARRVVRERFSFEAMLQEYEKLIYPRGRKPSPLRKGPEEAAAGPAG